MFFANISIAEKYNYLEEKFVRAYRWLAETDIKSLPEGSYPIWDDKVIARQGHRKRPGVHHQAPV